MSDQAQTASPAIDTKPWWQSRTLIVNGLVLALAMAEAKLNFLQPMLPINVYSLLAFGLPVVNAFLRVITTVGVSA